MAAPKTQFLDELIRYAGEEKLSIDKAAAKFADLARQRMPELRIENEIAHAKSKLQREIAASKPVYVIARIFVVTRVHEICWRYYPNYHVVTLADNYGWFRMETIKPMRKPEKKRNELYLDDLFYDRENGVFWMNEPYLYGLKTSQAFFHALTKRNSEVLKGTSFAKVSPDLALAFVRERSAAPEYKVAPNNNSDWRPNYGNRGWRNRLKLVRS